MLYLNQLWQLTVDQFMSLLNTNRHNKPEEANDSHAHKRYVHGVSGIKRLFNCSYPTAHKLKETIIKPAVHISVLEIPVINIILY